MTARFDTLTPGTLVTVGYATRGGRHTETAVFCGILGEGEDRRVSLASANSAGTLYKWQGYRSRGRWVYGSSAEALSLVAVAA